MYRFETKLKNKKLMKSNYLKHLFTALFLLCATVAAAHDFEVGGIYYNILSQEDKTVEVTYGTNPYTGSVVIPASVTFSGTIYSVTRIGDVAFNSTGITGIVIPNSVTSIGNGAFSSCSMIASIEIPDGITSIGNIAFANCTKLANIVIPNSVTSIGSGAFSGTTWYNNQPDGVVYAGKVLYNYKGTMPENSSIIIKDGTLSIVASAFAKCTKLTNIEIPNGVISIGDYAFSGCTGLTSIVIPNSVTNIGDCAFLHCQKLKSITIGNSVASIGGSAFFGCIGLERAELNCATIGDWFRGSSTIKEVAIGDGVTSIGSSAFESCSGLASIVIPNSVTSIGDRAFEGCTGLTNIEIPNSVTSIGSGAFRDCTSLTSITSQISAYALFTVETSVFGGVDKSTCTLYVPSSAKSKYASTDGWKDFVNIVELEGEPEVPPTIGGSCGENVTWALVDSVLTIDGTGAMYDYTSSSKAPWYEYIKEIKSVVIKDGVTRIGNFVFYKYSALTSVAIGNKGVISIGDYAFAYSGLTSVEIPNSVTSIGGQAFCGCSSLTGVVISDGGVGSIGNGAFCDCSALTSVVIGNSVVDVGKDAFRDCSALVSVVIGSNVTSIGDGVFYKCSSLASITIPNSVKSIGMLAFEGCNGLERVELNCKTIGKWFSGNPGIKEIIIGKSVTGIEDYAFSGCSGITNIVVEHGNVEYGSPENCNAIIKTETKTLVLGCKNTVIPACVESIAVGAFRGCSGLTSVTISNNVKSVGDDAFEGCTGLERVDLNCATIGRWFSNSQIKDVIIGNNVTTIENEAFYNCTNLERVELNCAIIGSWFSHSQIKNVIIGNSVTSIGDDAFYACSGLTSIEIPNSVTSIGGSAFESCSGLASIVIPNSVTRIGSGAFRNCSSLTSVEISNSITSIGRSAFEGCTGLKEVHISDLAAWCKIAFADSCANPLYHAKNLYLNGELLKDIVIPDGVTEIKNYAFYNCINITNLTIPNSVTDIGDYAFSNCTGLTSIEIPNSVKKIGKYVFSGCTRLASIEIADSVISIGSNTFEDTVWYKNQSDGVIYAGKVLYRYKGTMLENTSITIMDGTKSIGDYAFSGCSGLTSIEIPNSVTSIGKGVFNYCSNLTSIVSLIPANALFAVHTSVFNDVDKSICFLYVPSGAKGQYTSKEGWSGFTNIVEMEPVNNGSCGENATWELVDSVLTISGNGMMYDNFDLPGPWYGYMQTVKSIVVEDGITHIGAASFVFATALESVSLGNGVVSIGDNAFVACFYLTNITIPACVESIATGAFSGCTGLTSITSLIPAEELFTVNTNVFNGVDKATCTLYVPAGAKSKYASTDGWKDFTNIVEIEAEPEVPTIGGSCGESATWTLVDSVLTISGAGAMYDYTASSPAPWNEYKSDIKSVVIKEGITKIGNFAFYNCTYITNVTISNSVTIIGGSAFYGCSGLAGIVIPDSVTSIGGSAFKGCSNLASIVIGKGVTSIGEFAFDGCSALTRVELNCPTIGNWFSNSTIKEVVIGNNVTTIESRAFYNCTYITNVTISNSVTIIGEGAFEGCNALSKVHIGDLASWCGISFANPTANPLYYAKNLYLNGGLLTDLVIPAGVTEIKNYAFYNCTYITNVTISNSVTIIGGSAFYNCSGLAGITIGNSVTSIADYAFAGCTALSNITSLVTADKLFTISMYAFYNVDMTGCTLYVPAGAEKDYAATAGWSAFTNVKELEPTEVVTEVTITIGQYGSTVYSSPYALDFSDVEGLKAYAATGYKTNSQIITLTRVQTAEAGIGVFLKGEPGEYIVPVIESTDEHSLNMLVATLEKTEVNSTSSDGLYANFKYTIKSGDATPLFYRFADGSTLSAGKAYLQIPLAWLPATASKAINIRFDEGETTDIDELKGENGKAKTIYDLSGRAVENPASGIYIIDGKKVYVK